MNHASIGISLISLIPAMLLCAFVYYKDKAEKEPLGLLAILFAAGAIFYFPALFSELTVGGLIDSLFSSKMEFSFDGNLTYVTRIDKIAHLSLFALAVGIIEEGAKWLVLYFITRKNKNFNYLFDGIVYSTFVSMGFAAVESIRYAIIDGWDTLFMRAVTSVPGHLFFGIIMGYLYTVWHTYKMAENIENSMLSEGKIEEKKIKGAPVLLILSFILPVFAHLIYSFTSSYNSNIVTALFYVFVIALYIFSFINISKLSAKDTEGQKLAYALVLKKHYNIKENIDHLTTKFFETEGGDNE